MAYVSEDLEGRILLTLRRKGMTQRQLAQVIGISDVYLSDIIRGKRTGPKAIEKVEEIKTYLGIK